MISKQFLIVFIISVIVTASCGEEKSLLIDQNGYLVYCPCMGRFGNQAEHFLGALAFAKSLNRSLILPAWIEFKRANPLSIQIPFDRYFKVEPLEDYHRVITMEKFMEVLAPVVWPPEERISFCYDERPSLKGQTGHRDCLAKEGNPFGPFWDNYKIDFIKSTFFKPLNYDIHHRDMDVKWQERFSGVDYPVLAFTGAPASFPIQAENRALHKYMQWSDEIDIKANEFIKEHLHRVAFIGIHLRNGIDWTNACEHVKDSTNLFASVQCLGYRNEYGSLTMDICMPSKKIIVRQIKRQIKKMKELNPANEVRAIFVASDNDYMIDFLSSALENMNINVIKGVYGSPHIDLAILGRANHFIGNCVSSFTAFVKRERDAKGFPSSFWAFPTPKSQKKQNSIKETVHDEF